MPSGTFGIGLIVKVVVDVLLLIAVAIPVLLFYLVGKPVQRGFFCDDITIRYPYKDSTVTTGALYAFGTIIPVATIIVVEYVIILKGNSRSSVRERLVLWFWSLYHYIGVFLFGCALSQLMVDICKYSIGRLRPHFIDVCQPDFSKIVCDGGNFITENVCTNFMTTEKEMSKMKEARLSFMSGHASFSAFTMFYLIIYLQARFRPKHLQLIRPTLQFICFALAVYTCLSRISDNKHHWSDVLAGFVNGVVFAFFTTMAIGNSHPRRRLAMPRVNSVEMQPLKKNGGSHPSVSQGVDGVP